MVTENSQEVFGMLNKKFCLYFFILQNLYGAHLNVLQI